MTTRLVDAARANRRRTLEAKRAVKLERGPTLGDARGRWLERVVRSKYAPTSGAGPRRVDV